MGIRIHVDTEDGQNLKVLTARPHFSQVLFIGGATKLFWSLFGPFGGLYEAIFFWNFRIDDRGNFRGNFLPISLPFSVPF